MPTRTLWELGLGDEVISLIRETGYEFPWTYGELAEPMKLDRFRVLLGPDEEWPESPAFDVLLAEVEAKGGFWLRDTSTGERLKKVLVNHDGKSGVWFRTHR